MARREASTSSPNIGIVIVAYGNNETIRYLLDAIGKQKRGDDYLILVDNHHDHGCAEISEKHPEVNYTLRSHNIGFAAGCNRGASLLPKSVENILFINPDTLPSENLLQTLRSELPKNWAACMPVLTMNNRKKINSTGNILHLTGLSWCDAYSQPFRDNLTKAELLILSGACLFIRREEWVKIRGFAEDYFMYYEDTELSLRLVMSGLKIGLLPHACVDHDYSFRKGDLKWFYIERNRYLLIFRIYPAPVILALLPLFLITELFLTFESIIDKRFVLRLRSQISAFRTIPSQLKARKQIQKDRTISSSDFLALLSADVTTPLIKKVKWANSSFRMYKRVSALILRYIPEIKI